jgi:hypothetical protein
MAALFLKVRFLPEKPCWLPGGKFALKEILIGLMTPRASSLSRRRY